MTWHAARFLLLQSFALAFGAALVFGAWVFVHRGHRLGPVLRTVMGIVIVGGSVAWFTSILRGVLADGTVVAADRRLHNTLRLFHSEPLHLFYSSISNLAAAVFVVPVAIALAVLFWMHRRTYEAKVFVVAITGAEVMGVALKYIVRRPRPAEAAALVGGPSFPSGHTLTATAVYGVLLFLLLREKPRTWWHIVSAILLLTVVILVPISRVYLGVHWPHDVTASLALGCAWLACLTMLVRFRPDGTERLAKQAPLHRERFAALALLILIYAVVLDQFHVQSEARPQLPPARPALASVLGTFPPQIRRTSEDLIGGPMEPASFLFIGDASALNCTFARAGWQLAATPSATGLAHELACVILDRPDPNGPATPAYYAEQPQDFTFERPGTPDGSIRHRHHIRIWRSPICIDPGCVPLWVATCSYDMGIEFVAKPYLLTHRIDPNVDHEREFIAATLRSAGAADLSMITVTGPRRGTNAGGDAFSTDGRAHVMHLSDAHCERRSR
ncbi:MAG: hypothetical protein NVSMB68_05190 [Thermoanaerobaculia bacterium]